MIRRVLAVSAALIAWSVAMPLAAQAPAPADVAHPLAPTKERPSGESSSSAQPGAATPHHPDWAPWTRNSTQPPPAVEGGPVAAATPQAGDGETERVFRAGVAWFDEAVKRVDELVPAAEAAADGAIAGGRFYCTGDTGFVQELFGRAGGLGFLVEWRGERLRPNDVLLIGRLTPREETARNVNFLALVAGGGWNMPGTVVYISSSNFPVVGRTIPLIRKEPWGGRLHVLDTRAPLGDSWADVSLGQMSAVAIAHAFVGEMFAAASRKGKTLATLGSDAEPHGPEWDKSVEGMNLNPKFPVPPIAAGRIAKDYLLTCRRQAAAFLDSGEAKNVRLAGDRLAATLKAGKDVFVVCAGHIHVSGSAIPREFPRMTMYGRTWEWRNQVLRPGDILLYLGYLDFPRKPAMDARAAGAGVVTLSASDGRTDDRAVHVRESWERWDSAVNVPDYPVRLLPTSGVLQTLSWYSLMSETLKSLRAPSAP